MPGSKEWLFLGEALGATATPLAFGEVYLGLKTGTIDGQDNPLPTVRAAKFYEVTKQLVLTSHLVDGIFLSIANKTWNALTPAQKQKVKAAAAGRGAVQQREPDQGGRPARRLLQAAGPAGRHARRRRVPQARAGRST